MIGETIDAVSRVLVDQEREEVTVILKLYEDNGKVMRGLVLKMKINDLPQYPAGAELVHKRLNGSWKEWGKQLVCGCGVHDHPTEHHELCQCHIGGGRDAS